MREQIHRRVAGFHDWRLDGITDLILRAPGAKVLDIGCNRGMVGFEFATNGAHLIHGCDLDEDSIHVARSVFADLRSVSSRHEVVDLTGGPSAVQAAFGGVRYDIVLLLATYHKLRRKMSSSELHNLVVYIGKLCDRYLGWRATSEKFEENEQEMKEMDAAMKVAGMRRIHTSYISKELGVAAIWGR